MCKLINCQKVDWLSAVYPKVHPGLLDSLRSTVVTKGVSIQQQFQFKIVRLKVKINVMLKMMNNFFLSASFS